jgi:hypothetical protein
MCLRRRELADGGDVRHAVEAGLEFSRMAGRRRRSADRARLAFHVQGSRRARSNEDVCWSRPEG